MAIFLANIKEFFQIYFFEAVKSVRVVDVIDVILLTFVLYYIYYFIKERRAGKLLIGLASVLVISIVGDALDMYATTFIFSDFRQIGMLAILILFQPELRSALEKVGGMPTTGIRNITADSRDSSQRTSEIIDAVCQAASDMSKEKVGALIVIERSTKLGDYTEAGTVLDARVSDKLLRNIFFNKSPLHDGAVIIRSGRIFSAGCVLPLSMKEDIHKELGTRHRAAIGVTENSDAVVIVVSEETGTISLSVDGSLQRNYNYFSLKQELNKRLISQGSSEGQKGRVRTKKSKKRRSDRSDAEEL